MCNLGPHAGQTKNWYLMDLPTVLAIDTLHVVFSIQNGILEIAGSI